MSTLYKKAINFASQFHGDQKYGTEDYSYHYVGVKNVVETQFVLGNEMLEHCRVVAILHDTIEDTDATFGLIRNTFNEEIALDVLHLSRTTENYEEYIVNLIKKGSDSALVVKLADLMFNINHNDGTTAFNKTRLDKYRLAKTLIKTIRGNLYEMRIPRY